MYIQNNEIILNMPASLSEKTAQLKRQHILQAAIAVFATHGFRGATIRMVADEAGVSDGTIYNSFENKTALLLATLDPQDDQMGPPALDVPISAEALIRMMFVERWRGFTPDNLKVQKAIFSEVLVNDELRTLYFAQVLSPVLNLAQPVFADLLDRGQIKPVDVSLVLRSMAALMLGFVTLRLLGDEKTIEDWDRVPDLLADMLINGLVSTP